jgi:hypothetical protein
MPTGRRRQPPRNGRSPRRRTTLASITRTRRTRAGPICSSAPITTSTGNAACRVRGEPGHGSGRLIEPHRPTEHGAHRTSVRLARRRPSFTGHQRERLPDRARLRHAARADAVQAHAVRPEFGGERAAHGLHAGGRNAGHEGHEAAAQARRERHDCAASLRGHPPRSDAGREELRTHDEHERQEECIDGQTGRGRGVAGRGGARPDRVEDDIEAVGLLREVVEPAFHLRLVRGVHHRPAGTMSRARRSISSPRRPEMKMRAPSAASLRETAEPIAPVAANTTAVLPPSFMSRSPRPVRPHQRQRLSGRKWIDDRPKGTRPRLSQRVDPHDVQFLGARSPALLCRCRTADMASGLTMMNASGRPSSTTYGTCGPTKAPKSF